MKITEPIQPPDHWWVGLTQECKCFRQLELEESDKLITRLGDYGWMVEFKCPKCGYDFAKYYDLAQKP